MILGDVNGSEQFQTWTFQDFHLHGWNRPWKKPAESVNTSVPIQIASLTDPATWTFWVAINELGFAV